MNSHRHTLEPYTGMSSRYPCPAPDCKKGKTFSRYIDTETGEQLPDHVGRCNREVNCGYHYTPKQYFEDTGEGALMKDKSFRPPELIRKPEVKAVSYIPAEVLKQSLKSYEKNYFVKYLISLFGPEDTGQLISRYFIGSSRHWEGATVFWQIDLKGKVRTGKIMVYSPATGKRVKEPYDHFTFAHKVLKTPEFTLKQSFFGEHLLKDKSKPVGIVESEKTAIIASQYLPQFIWLAVGGLNNLSRKICLVLESRDVILFPDLSKPEAKVNCYELWCKKAKEFGKLMPNTKFIVSDLLERKATEAERRQGFDLVDYLVKFNYPDFILPEPEPAKAIEDNSVNSPIPKVPHIVRTENEGPFFEEDHLQPFGDSWSEGWPPIATKTEEACKGSPTLPAWEIEELESFFNSHLPPDGPVKLGSGTITDIPLFIRSHMATIKANQGKRSFKPYYERLQQLKEIIKNPKNI